MLWMRAHVQTACEKITRTTCHEKKDGCCYITSIKRHQIKNGGKARFLQKSFTRKDSRESILHCFDKVRDYQAAETNYDFPRIYLLQGNAFDFDVGVQRQRLDSDTSPAWLYVPPVLSVNLVHLQESHDENH